MAGIVPVPPGATFLGSRPRDAASTAASADAMHDITVGNNDVAEIGGGFDTATRWDPVTGLGTPRAAALLPMLVQRSS